MSHDKVIRRKKTLVHLKQIKKEIVMTTTVYYRLVFLLLSEGTSAGPSPDMATETVVPAGPGPCWSSLDGVAVVFHWYGPKGSVILRDS